METTVQAKFNKQTKDSKKELVEFWLTGEDENKPELSQMTREVVILQLDGQGPEITCVFTSTSKDSKKTVLKFEVEGDKSGAKTFEFYKKAGLNVQLNIKESQMDIEDFKARQKEAHEGISGTIAKDGTVEVDDNQMKLDDIPDVPDEENKTPDEKSYVEVEQEQKPLTASQKKKLEKQKAIEQQNIEDQKIIHAQETNDEDLPF